MTDLDSGLASLGTRIDGDMLTDPISRRVYATDASPYEVLPIGIARPRHAEDCVALVQFATELKVPLIPRGAGYQSGGPVCGRWTGGGSVSLYGPHQRYRCDRPTCPGAAWGGTESAKRALASGRVDVHPRPIHCRPLQHRWDDR